MNNRQKRTLEAIFTHPTLSNIRWTEIESLIESVGIVDRSRAGSRVRFEVKGIRASFHRPHPKPETNQHTVRDIRDFLKAAGIKPE